MKQTKNFNINVPELGDKPDITQVSDAIQALEDALAGTLEIMNAEIQGTKLTLTSGARTTKRTKYYEGMAIKFVAPIQINPNAVTTVSVDGLSDQTLQIPYLVNAGDSVDIIYKDNKFVGAITAIQRSNAIDSISDTTVATSLAVKTLNDNKAEKTVQIIAGNGLTGGGDLTTNRTISVVSADDGIIVSANNIRINTTNDVDSTSTTRPASARAVKGAYDKAVEALNKGTQIDNSKVSKSGDTMTGTLALPNIVFSGVSGTSIRGGNSGELILEGEKPYAYVSGAYRRIYHQGFKPTPNEIGAVSASDVYSGGGSGGTFNKIPRVGGDGVLEIGRYIDFHHDNNDPSDFTARLTCTSSGTVDFTNGISCKSIYTSGAIASGGNLELGSGSEFFMNIPITDGGHARGNTIKGRSGEILGGWGWLGGGSHIEWLGFGFGENYWGDTTGLKCSRSEVKFNNSHVLRLQSNGATFRISSDGFKECWGAVTLYGDESIRNVTLPVTFSNMEYALVANTRPNANNQDIEVSFARVNGNTINYFNNYHGTGGAGVGFYYCCGY